MKYFEAFLVSAFSLTAVTGNLAQAKPSLRPATSTLYIGRHYEVRDHDQPVKYVLNGQTRVARVTGSLASTFRVQKLRLQAGWNLCSVALTITNAVDQVTAPSAGLVAATYVFDPGSHSWVELTTDMTLEPGSVLWVQARANGTLSLKGGYSEPAAKLNPAGNVFLGPPGLHTLPLTNSGLVAFQFVDHSWWARAPPLPNLPEAWPSILMPGTAAFIQAGEGVELNLDPPELRIAFFHQDHLGSSSVMSDATGALLRETAYFPFGSARHEASVTIFEAAYAFSQKEKDLESRLHYFEARYLTSALARFTRVDSKHAALDALSPERLSAILTEPQEHNLYAYVNNNPLRYVDPNGFEKKKALIIIGAGQEDIKSGTRFPTKARLKQAAEALFAPYAQDAQVETHVVTSAQEMLRLIKSQKWESVSYMGHGVLNSKELDPGHDYPNTLKEADLIAALVAANPKNVQLLGCASASTGLARSVSKSLPGATVRGMYDLLDVDWIQEGRGKRVTRNELVPKSPYVEYKEGYQLENGKRASRRYWEPGDPRLSDRDMALEAGPPTVPQ